jgi:hypothetical protein
VPLRRFGRAKAASFDLPFIVRRDHRIVAAFAKKSIAEEWARMQSRFTVHTAAEVFFVFQDGEEVR